MTEHNQQVGSRRFYARPTDRSFEAYKQFLECMADSLGIAQDLSEDKLRRGWQKFWEAAGSDRSGKGGRLIPQELDSGRNL